MKLAILSKEMQVAREITQEMQELRARNQERADAFKVAMGKHYLLHPANAPKKVQHKSVLS